MKKKRHVGAAIFMAAAIAASIPLGANRSLMKLREEASGHYYYDDTGYALYEGLERRCAEANNLITLAEKYAEQDSGLRALSDSLEHQVKLFEKYEYEDENQTFQKIASLNAQLDQPAEALAAALEKADLSENDKKYPAQILANMRSEQDKLARSSYNDQARDYNEKLARMRPIAFLKPMATFDEAASEPSAQGEAAEQGETAQTAEEALESRVDAFAQDVENRAETFGQQVEDQVDSLVDGIMDSIFN